MGVNFQNLTVDDKELGVKSPLGKKGEGGQEKKFQRRKKVGKKSAVANERLWFHALSDHQIKKSRGEKKGGGAVCAILSLGA